MNPNIPFHERNSNTFTDIHKNIRVDLSKKI